jgi:hypothetical protein
LIAIVEDSAGLRVEKLHTRLMGDELRCRSQALVDASSVDKLDDVIKDQNKLFFMNMRNINDCSIISCQHFSYGSGKKYISNYPTKNASERYMGYKIE